MKPTEINPTEIEEVFVPSRNISFDNYLSLIKDLKKLTIDIYSLEENESFNIIFLYEHKLVDRFITIGRTIFSYIYQDDIFKMDIYNYLMLKDAYEMYKDVYYHLSQYLVKAYEKIDTLEFDYLSKDNAFFMVNYLLFKSNSAKSFLNKHLVNGDRIKHTYRSQLDNAIDLVYNFYQKLNLKIDFRHGDELKEFVINEFRNYVKSSTNRLPQKLKISVQKLKSSRLEPTSKSHWAKLADADDEVIKKFLNDELNLEDLQESKKNPLQKEETNKMKSLLRILKSTSDPENLFDWNILFQEDELFDRYVHYYSLIIFFIIIHRQNLIKCEMYDGLKEQYHKFIFGDEEDKMNTPAPALSKAKSLASEQEQMELKQSAAPEEHYIHQQIDEDKLIAFILSYTDGPNKSNYFVNKSHWLSIYIVLHQKLKKLGNSSVFLYRSRPKFVEWVNTKIKPQSVLCDQGVLDNAPKYFRDEKKYPWTIEDYYNAGGTQESTYNSYSMVADYFQRNLIDKIDEFFSFSS
jgi:hypothetical protein